MEVLRPGGLALTQKAADIIGLSRGDRVLDVGCGLGSSLCFLQGKYNIDAFGVDINPELVNKATARVCEKRVFCADACDLPFEDESFDAVFMECVLSLTSDPEKALSEAERVLHTGGHLVISSLDGASVLLENGRIGREELVTELKQLGFDTISLFDETAALRQFVAEIIFDYDSLENYIIRANALLGADVLNCDVPKNNTGYILLIAKK